MDFVLDTSARILQALLNKGNREMRDVDSDPFSLEAFALVNPGAAGLESLLGKCRSKCLLSACLSFHPKSALKRGRLSGLFGYRTRPSASNFSIVSRELGPTVPRFARPISFAAMVGNL
jgi:hypothetical protein